MASRFTLIVCVLVIVLKLSRGQHLPTESETICKQDDNCALPDCFCANNKKGPASTPAQKRPQIVVISFNDAVNVRNFGYYQQMLKSGWTNSNGCPVSFTLFVPDAWTNYTQVQQLWLAGAEIASFGVSGYRQSSYYYNTMTKDQLIDEVAGQKKNFVQKAQIPPDAVRGFRMPHFDASGPDLYDVIAAHYTYDSTLIASRNSMQDPPTWPSTLTFPWPLKCKVYGRCPTSYNASVWEIPVNVLLDLNDTYECQFLDACVNAPRDEEGAFQLLWRNFLPFYHNRTPFVLNMRATWLNTDYQRTAFHRLVYSFLEMPEVYVVTMSQMIDWMKNATNLDDILSFEPWLCPKRTLYNSAESLSHNSTPVILSVVMLSLLINNMCRLIWHL